MHAGHLPSGNRLLAALDIAANGQLRSRAEPVTLVRDEVLSESGEASSDTYFPVDVIVSVCGVLEDGASADIAVIGNEGMVGLPAVTGVGAMPFRAMAQSDGSAFRIKARFLRDEFDRNPVLRGLLLRYAQVLTTQIAQTAVCNRRHTVEQQLCRWLLLSLDCVSSRTLHMTQELIAYNLGVRREAVTAAARRLQQSGVIDYSRGHIIVHDRPRLEALCCECYALVRDETDRLLPPRF